MWLAALFICPVYPLRAAVMGRGGKGFSAERTGAVQWSKQESGVGKGDDRSKGRWKTPQECFRPGEQPVRGHGGRRSTNKSIGGWVCRNYQQGSGCGGRLLLRESGQEEPSVSGKEKSGRNSSFYLFSRKWKDWANVSCNNARFWSNFKIRTVLKEPEPGVEHSFPWSLCAHHTLCTLLKGVRKFPLTFNFIPPCVFKQRNRHGLYGSILIVNRSNIWLTLDIWYVPGTMLST